MVLRDLFFSHEQRPAGKTGASASGNVAMLLPVRAVHTF